MKPNPDSADPSPAPRSGARLVWFLLAVIVLLLGLHVVNQVMLDHAAAKEVVRFDEPTYRLRYRLLDVDREMSLPAWFSTLLLAGNAGLMLLIAAGHRGRGEPGGWGWALLGSVFLGLSLDEAASVHDTIGNHVRALLDDDAPDLFYAAWYLVVVPLVALLGLVLLPWLWRLPRWVAVRLLGAGAVFLLGAVGCEAVMSAVFIDDGGDPPLQGAGVGPMLLVMLEEGLEMVSMLWVLHTLLRYARQRWSLAVVPMEGEPRDGTPARSERGLTG